MAMTGFGRMLIRHSGTGMTRGKSKTTDDGLMSSAFVFGAVTDLEIFRGSWGMTA